MEPSTKRYELDAKNCFYSYSWIDDSLKQTNRRLKEQLKMCRSSLAFSTAYSAIFKMDGYPKI